MLNCAMIGAEPRRLSLYEYEALLALHNDAHNPDGPQVAPPSREEVEQAFARLAANPKYTH